MISWTDAADRALLLTIISEGASSIRWPNVAASMVKKGYQVTDRACMQHFAKIKKEADSHKPGQKSSSIARGCSSAMTGNTKVTKKTSRPVASKKRKQASQDDDDHGDDEEAIEMWEHPVTKRSKNENKYEYDDENMMGQQDAYSFKIEDVDDHGVGRPRQLVNLENDDLYQEDQEEEY